MKRTVTDRIHAAQRAHAELFQAREALETEATSDGHAAYQLGDAAAQYAGAVAEAAARIAGGEYRAPYNGWTNRETWNASLWINNDQATQESALDIMRDAINGADWDSRGSRDLDMERTYLLNTAADALRDWWRDEALAETDNAPPDSGPVADAWSYAVAVVDWREIAEGLAEDRDIDHLPPARR